MVDVYTVIIQITTIAYIERKDNYIVDDRLLHIGLYSSTIPSKVQYKAVA